MPELVNIRYMNRRAFISSSLAAGASRAETHGKVSGRPRIAAIVTVYTPNSHADVFLGRLLEGYRLEHVSYRPRLELASMYLDQAPANSMAAELAEEYGFRIYSSIPEALRCGGRSTAVDGVAIIGEHGNYPFNSRGQHLYPRREFYEQVAKVMEADRHVAPIFVDKHLSYSWENASWMYETARRMKIPLMAGSTVSLTRRVPPLQLDGRTALDEAIVVGSGDTEAYGFHALEALQAIVERRKGAETGVASVQAVQGARVWEIGSEGGWSRELFEAALARTPSRVPGDPQQLVKEPVLFLVNYRDGLKGRVLIMNGLLRSWVFAAFPRGSRKPVSTDCRISFLLHTHWGYMVRNFEDLVISGKLPNPVERTLLTTGILAAAFDSMSQGGAQIPTPHLEIRYRGGESRSVMGDAYRHRSSIGKQVVDAVRDGDTGGVGTEVVIVDQAGRKIPTRAGIFEVPDEFAFLGVDTNNGQTPTLEALPKIPEVKELIVAIGAEVGGEFLVIDPQGITHLMEEASDSVGTDDHAEVAQSHGNLVGSPPGPLQTGDGIASSIVFEQELDQGDDVGGFFSTCFRPPPERRVLPGVTF